MFRIATLVGMLRSTLPILPLAVLLLLCCEQKPAQTQAETKLVTEEKFLVRFPATYEFGDAFGYVNVSGDTVIDIGQYSLSFTDTISLLGFVAAPDGTPLGINSDGQELFEVYWVDNGPDYLSEGLFRIVKDGKIGFGDSLGAVVIQPRFECAFPFSDGKAKVSFDCEVMPGNDEHQQMTSDAWFYIDKSGNTAPNQTLQ